MGAYRSYGTVEVGSGPRGVAVDPGLHRAYVVGQNPAIPSAPVTVSVLDTRTRSTAATITVDNVFVRETQPLVVDPATHLVYLLGAGPHGKLIVIDPATDSVTARIFLGEHTDSSALAIDSDRHLAYVANNYYATVVAIDTDSRDIVAVIPVGAHPAALAIDPASHQVWAATAGSLSIIDPDAFKVSATIPATAEPHGVAIDSETHTAYITDFAPGTSVMLIDTATHAATHISLQPEPSYAVAIDPALHTVYLTSGAFESINMIDTRTRTLTASRTSGHSAGWTGGIAVDPTTHETYVTHGETAHTVEVLTPA
ncbi:YncE family protein [Nocardia sp. NPDC046763]|uniref:YncE family protein n=1 Tax=Nocardia sp. NPDC046763 TaxID=3155256 RepID=UPI0033C22BCE